MVFNDSLKNSPYFISPSLNKATGTLDIGCKPSFGQLVNNKGFEEFKRHLFGQTALINFQAGADDDNRTSRVVHSFPQQVLPETPLLPSQEIGEALKRTVSRTQNSFASAPVINQGIHRFLQHSLLVTHDNIRCAQFLKLF